jgi:hypothetical protein
MYLQTERLMEVDVRVVVRLLKQRIMAVRPLEYPEVKLGGLTEAVMDLTLLSLLVMSRLWDPAERYRGILPYETILRFLAKLTIRNIGSKNHLKPRSYTDVNTTCENDDGFA